MAGVDLNVVPKLGRPAEVERALGEAAELRDRLRAANDELIAAKHALEQAEADDVAAAAEKIKSGAAPGNLSAAVGKARHAVELAQRNRDALDLVARTALDELTSVLHATSDDWLAALDEQKQASREAALAALDAFEQATADLRGAASTAAWLRSGDWGRLAPSVIVGSQAASSRRITANSEPLQLDQLLVFVREVLDEPVPPPRHDLAPPEPLDVVESGELRRG